MQASFDDGGNNDGSLICVAGYFFRDAALAPFREEWRRLLKWQRFHMVDLVHGREDFRDLGKPERDNLARGLIAAIKEHMTLGVVISVERTAYEKHVDRLDDVRAEVGSPFALCAMLCLGSSASWMEANGIDPEEIIYSFESGNSKQADANKFLDKVIRTPAMEERYHYVSHSFVKKNKLPSLDAADLLGWEWAQHCKRLTGEEHRPVRASLKSLCEKPHIGEHFDETNVRIAFAKRLLEPFVVPGAHARFARPQLEGW